MIPVIRCVFIPPLLLLAVDNNRNSIQRNWQYDSMLRLRLLENESPEERIKFLGVSNLIWKPLEAADECEWKGVDCRDTDTIYSIVWNRKTGFQYDGLNLMWLPAALRIVKIEEIRLCDHCRFQIDMLPRESRAITVNYANIGGTPDLGRLPVHTERLSLVGNRFSGTLYLTNLPSSLYDMYLTQNDFNHVIVLNSAFSTAFMKAEISTRKKGHKIRATEVNGERIRSSIWIFWYDWRGHPFNHNDKPIMF